MDNSNKNHLENIRLSYAHVLKAYLRLHDNYNHLKIKITDEESKKIFQLLDQSLYGKKGKLNWNNIHPLMPANLEKSIKKKYVMLSDNEVKQCCLLLFSVPCKDIAAVLSLTQQSVHSITYRIKQKAGMKNIRESLKPFVLFDP